MPEIKHTGGPGRFNHTAIGVSERGDTHDVSEDAAAYLCDDLGHFDRTGEITLEDGEYTVEDADADEDAGVEIDEPLEEHTYDELRDISGDLDIEGRGSMDKEELIDAIEAADTE